jgi:DNA invertase Pin-like site-specific DNA recombinase
MGRLVLIMLLSFAQFEREIIAERTRDKIAARASGSAAYFKDETHAKHVTTTGPPRP